MLIYYNILTIYLFIEKEPSINNNIKPKDNKYNIKSYLPLMPGRSFKNGIIYDI